MRRTRRWARATGVVCGAAVRPRAGPGARPGAAEGPPAASQRVKTLAEGGDLLWVVDQRVTCPGPTPPPRKLHLIYRFHISPDVRATLAEQELDELPDGSHEVGVIEWIDYRKTAELPIFPPIGPALAALAGPRAAVANAALDAVTDANHTWV